MLKNKAKKEVVSSSEGLSLRPPLVDSEMTFFSIITFSLKNSSIIITDFNNII